MTEREGRTSDGVEITHDLRVWTNDLRVWTNDLRRGSVVIDDSHRPHQEAGEWWFSVLEDGARHPTLSSRPATQRQPLASLRVDAARVLQPAEHHPHLRLGRRSAGLHPEHRQALAAPHAGQSSGG